MTMLETDPTSPIDPDHYHQHHLKILKAATCRNGGHVCQLVTLVFPRTTGYRPELTYKRHSSLPFGITLVDRLSYRVLPIGTSVIQLILMEKFLEVCLEEYLAKIIAVQKMETNTSHSDHSSKQQKTVQRFGNLGLLTHRPTVYKSISTPLAKFSVNITLAQPASWCCEIQHRPHTE